jgi:membrane protease subunit HflK
MTDRNNKQDMAWNEPGGSGGNGDDRDPWGNRGGDQTPPDLEEAIRNLQNKIRGIFGGGSGGSANGSSGGILGIVMLLLVGWLAYDMTYIVDEAERGVVLRFGKYVDTLDPGMSIRAPRPIEDVYKVNVEELRTVSIGSTKAESLMLTQDENIIDIKFTVQYQVKDAKNYLFNVNQPDMTLSQATESAVREIVGRNTMDHVITAGRGSVADKAQELIQEILDFYETGLLIVSLNMQDAQAPEQVQDAFADAVKAREDEERYKNEAEAYARDVIGKVQGAVQRILLDADAYRDRIIEVSQGDTERFSLLLSEYERAPEVTRERLYIESIEDVMSNSSKVMVDSKGSNNLLYLPFDKLIEQQTRTPRSQQQSTQQDIDMTNPPVSETSINQNPLRSRER